MTFKDTRTLSKFFSWYKYNNKVNLRPYFKQFVEEYPRTVKAIDKDFCDELLGVICQDLRLDYGTLISKCRRQEYCTGRYIAITALRQKRYSLKKIGEILGGRDHSSIVHGLEMFNNYYLMEKEFKKTADSIFKKLNVKI